MSDPRTTPLRVGILGLGLMGRRMLGSLSQHDGFRAVAGFDLDRERTTACAREFGFEASASCEALLDRDDLDLVYVATPPASHVALARAVIERGTPLFLEKPLAVDLESAERLVREVERAALPAAMNFPFATLPGLRRIERELAQGSAGAPLRVEIELHFDQWPRRWHTAGPWLAGDREGGFLREVFSHFAYLTQRLLGPLNVESCVLARLARQSESRVVADLRCGTVPVSLVGGVGGAAPDFNRWTLFAEQRSYRLEDWSRVSFSDGTAWCALPPDAEESAGAAGQLDQLAALLRGEPACLPGLRDGLEVMRCVEALLDADGGRRSL